MHVAINVVIGKGQSRKTQAPMAKQASTRVMENSSPYDGGSDKGGRLRNKASRGNGSPASAGWRSAVRKASEEISNRLESVGPYMRGASEKEERLSALIAPRRSGPPYVRCA